MSSLNDKMASLDRLVSALDLLMSSLDEKEKKEKEKDEKLAKEMNNLLSYFYIIKSYVEENINKQAKDKKDKEVNFNTETHSTFDDPSKKIDLSDLELKQNHLDLLSSSSSMSSFEDLGTKAASCSQCGCVQNAKKSHSKPIETEIEKKFFSIFLKNDEKAEAVKPNDETIEIVKPNDEKSSNQSIAISPKLHASLIKQLDTIDYFLCKELKTPENCLKIQKICLDNKRLIDKLEALSNPKMKERSEKKVEKTEPVKQNNEKLKTEDNLVNDNFANLVSALVNNPPNRCLYTVSVDKMLFINTFVTKLHITNGDARSWFQIFERVTNTYHFKDYDLFHYLPFFIDQELFGVYKNELKSYQLSKAAILSTMDELLHSNDPLEVQMDNLFKFFKVNKLTFNQKKYWLSAFPQIPYIIKKLNDKKNGTSRLGDRRLTDLVDYLECFL